MATAGQKPYYWHARHRIIPALLLALPAVFFLIGTIGLAVNCVRKGLSEGFSGELIFALVVGPSVYLAIAALLGTWSLGFYRSGQLSVSDTQVLFPRSRLSPMCAFPEILDKSRIIAIDFDEESVELNNPPELVFHLKMRKPKTIRLKNYPDPDTMYEYLKEKLGSFSAPAKE